MNNSPLDALMLGQFVMQYEDGAQGFFVNADEAQQVAQQVKQALSLVGLLGRCAEFLERQPVGSVGHGLAQECFGALPSQGTFRCPICGKDTPHHHDRSEQRGGAA
jgi:hypothetical protein